MLQAELGTSARVIAEGLNGRTTAFDDHLADADRNGARILPTILSTHEPLDLVIILLGTNDMKPFICGSAIGAKAGHGASRRYRPRPCLFASARLRRRSCWSRPRRSSGRTSRFCRRCSLAAWGESKKLAGLYRGLADQNACGFFDAGSVARTTPLDGIHLDAENTRAIGSALAPVVRQMLEDLSEEISRGRILRRDHHRLRPGRLCRRPSARPSSASRRRSSSASISAASALNWGCIPTKALLRSAEILHYAAASRELRSEDRWHRVGRY